MNKNINLEIKKTHLTEEQARAAITEYIQTTGKSQAEVGREMRYASGSLISQFQAGARPSGELIRRIEQLLKISAKREAAPKKPPFQMTSASKQVMNLIDLCHTLGEMGVAYGDPGVGKTMAIRQYAKEEGKNAIVITVSPTTANITGVNELLAAALDIKEKGSRRITTEVITKLKGTKRVIIIDEAQHLKAKVVNHLRSIVDATENEETGERIGMALVGNHEIYFELKIRQQAAYRQVADRITYWELLRAEDVVMDDIRLIFTDIDLDNSCLEILYLISKMVSVRKAIQVYTNAVSLFQDSQNQNSQESDGESGEGETMQNPQNEMGAGYLAAVALKMGVDINRK